MKTTAEKEQKIFWDIFDHKLDENGNPFYAIHEKNGHPTYWANVNRKKAFGPDKTLGVEFKFQTKKVRVGIYLHNDLFLFNRLYANKDQIEKELGFSAEWNYIGIKNPNTRRIYIEFDLKFFDREYYTEIIDQILPYVMRFKEAFEHRIPGLFDK